MAYRNFKGYGSTTGRDNQIITYLIISVILLPIYFVIGILKLLK